MAIDFVSGLNGTARIVTGVSAIADGLHKFRVVQTVDLIPATFRSAAKGTCQIVSLRPIVGGSTQCRIKTKSEAHERVVSEGELVLSPKPKFDFD
ncbi:MAG TPA: hypothetical protein VGJ20_13280 [Xanthobacteraceae bacterium]|jgi:hypothetical protein